MALISDYYFDTVVALGVPRKDKSVNFTATGFLYGYPITKNEKRQQTYWVYLVTNRHVIEPANDIIVRFNAVIGKKPVTLRIPLGGSENAEYWTFHPDSDVDVAVLSIDTFLTEAATPDIKMCFMCQGRHTTTRNEMSKSEFSEGNQVFVLGFPMGLAGDSQNHVILRQGTVARIRDWYHGEAKSFLIDSFVFPGNSGSPVISKPVFVSYGNKPRIESKLIGMVSNYLLYTDIATSGQTGRQKLVSEENSGLANVTPIDAIQETILIANSKNSKRD